MARPSSRRAARRFRGRARALKTRGGFVPGFGLRRAPKPEGGFQSLRRKKGDIDIPKVKKLLFNKPKVRRSKNVELSEAVQFENGLEKETVVMEEREVEYAPVLSNRGLYSILQAVGNLQKRTNSGPPSSKLPGSGGGSKEGYGLFNKMSLPEGSTLVSKITLGKNALPSKAIATEAEACVYSSEINAPGNTLMTAPAFQLSSVGINETQNALIPVQFADEAYMRMSLMQDFTKHASRTPTVDQIGRMYDSPTGSGEHSGVEPYSGGKGRMTYVPFRTKADWTFTNVNRTLACDLKVHIVQLKREGEYPDTKPLTIDPWRPMLDCLTRMPDNNKINTTVGTALARAGITHECWGYTTAEFADYVGRYSAKTVTGYPLSSSPVFEDRFNVLKTLKFNVSAGCSRKIELTNHINRCYTKFGTAATIMGDDVNSGLDTRMFLLVEISGQKNVPFYKATYNSETTPPTREWSLADSAPCDYYMELDQHVAYGIETRLREHHAQGGLPYKRSFISVENESNVSEVFHTDNIVDDESHITSSNTQGYIVPVSQDKLIIGQQMRVAEKDSSTSGDEPNP